MENISGNENQQATGDLETASSKQFVKKSLSDVTTQLMHSAGMVRGKSELMSKLDNSAQVNNLIINNKRLFSPRGVEQPRNINLFCYPGGILGDIVLLIV